MYAKLLVTCINKISLNYPQYMPGLIKRAQDNEMIKDNEPVRANHIPKSMLRDPRPWEDSDFFQTEYTSDEAEYSDEDAEHPQVLKKRKAK